MSNPTSNEMKAKLREIKRLELEVTRWLIDNPCLDDNPQKEEMYQLAICYYVAKRNKCRFHESASYNGVMSIELEALVDSYKKAEGNSKQEYARKIARYLLEGTTDYWLKLISDQIKEEAFQITIEYLEQQKSS